MSPYVPPGWGAKVPWHFYSLEERSAEHLNLMTKNWLSKESPNMLMHAVIKKITILEFNRRSRRKRGYVYLRFEGLKVWAKQNWDSQQGRTFTLPSQRNFHISFQPNIANSWVLLEDAKKQLVFHFEGGHHAALPQTPVIKDMTCKYGRLWHPIWSTIGYWRK